MMYVIPLERHQIYKEKQDEELRFFFFGGKYEELRWFLSWPVMLDTINC